LIEIGKAVDKRIYIDINYSEDDVPVEAVEHFTKKQAIGVIFRLIKQMLWV
jgi:hypothetical protein